MVDFHLLDKLEETSGLLNKKKIFEEFCLKQENRDFIYLTYNNVDYNIGKTIMKDVIEKTNEDKGSVWVNYDVIDDKAVFKKIEDLPNYSGNALKTKLGGIFSSLNDTQTKWFRRAILHNLEMGFSEKLINGVLKEMGYDEVYLFKPPQLCGVIKTEKGNILFSENLPDKLIVEEKYDGVRCLVKKKGDVVDIISRNGKKYKNFKTLEEEFRKFESDFIIDGEILYVDEFSNAVQNFQKLTTMLQRLNVVDDSKIKFYAFDVIELDYENKTVFKQLTRKDILKELVGEVSIFIKTSPYYNHDKEKIQRFYDVIMKQGGEGVIIKDPNADYVFDSRNRWWKVKSIIDDTFEVVGFGLGEGKSNADKVGYIEVLVDGKTCRVGSGFTDKIVDWMTQNKDKLVGMRVDIRYTERTKDGVLRFPRFVKFRE